jgi:hypothetical protein
MHFLILLKYSSFDFLNVGSLENIALIISMSSFNYLTYLLSDQVVRYLRECLEKCSGHLSLKTWCYIEDTITSHFNFSAFKDLGHGTFLHFLQSHSEVSRACQEMDVIALAPVNARKIIRGAWSIAPVKKKKFVCTTTSYPLSSLKIAYHSAQRLRRSCAETEFWHDC